MKAERERILSEFIDAWNAGERPDVDDYIARAPEEERAELADELVTFLSFAPGPAYSEATLEELRSDPIVVEALSAHGERGGLLPALLGRLRERFAMGTDEVAGGLVQELGLPSDKTDKTAAYLERLERGELEPTRVSRRVFAGLAHMFGVSRGELEGAGDFGLWGTPSPAPVFRAEDEAAASVSQHLDVLADALEAPGGAGRDEVDDLFTGGR